MDVNEPPGPVVGGAVLLHPHPHFGGDRFHPLIDELYRRLPSVGVGTVRFDFASADPESSRDAAREAADEARRRFGTVAAVGYSFGGGVASHVDADAWVLVAPQAGPIGHPDAVAGTSANPKLVIVAEDDQFSSPEAVTGVVDGWPHATVVVVEGDHFLWTVLSDIVDRIVDWLPVALVRSRLLAMAARDQALAQASYEASQRRPDHANRFLFDIPRDQWLPEYEAAAAAAAEHVEGLRSIVDAVGWPDRSRFGEAACRAAWLLAQHAGKTDLELQQRCASLLRERVAEGEGNPEQLAALLDRIELEHGRRQRYGTHLEPDGEGSWRPVRGVADPEHLDGRRAELGIGPWAGYLADCVAGRSRT